LFVLQATASAPSLQRFHAMSADVTVASENTRIIEEVTIWNHGHPPDIVWANAGLAMPSLLLDASIETLRAQMDVNYWAAVYLAQATLRAWLQPPKPDSVAINAHAHEPLPRHFITTSSAVAFCGVAGYAPYSPAKAALRSLHDTLRSELNLYSGAAAATTSGTPSIPQIKLHIVFPGTILTSGYTTENLTKHPVTKILEAGDPAQTEDEAAVAAIKELERGRSMITTQMLVAAMKVSALGGSVRDRWFVDTVFGWVTSIAWLFIGPDMERKVWRWGRENGMPVHGSG